MLFETGSTHMMFYEAAMYNVPLAEVYSRAAWKQTEWSSLRLSSMVTCIPNPASGFTLGRLSRSVLRTKKFPWNV